jgi:hypothetical protein
MTRSKTPFDQSRAWPDPNDQGAEHAGSHDPHLAWPHQQPAYDPRGYAGQQSGGAGQHTFDRSAAPPQYYPQQDYPPQETPLQGHYDQYGGHAAGYGQQAGGYEPPSGGSHQPDPLTADPHGQFYHQPGQHPAPGGYAYQDYNTPPTQPPSAQQGGFGSHDSYVAAQLRPATHEHAPDPGWGNQAALPGQPVPYPQSGQPVGDPQGYDLGSYMPSGEPATGRPAFGEPGYQPRQDWTDGGAGQSGYEAGYQDPYLPGGQHGYDQSQQGFDQHGFKQPAGAGHGQPVPAGAVTQHADAYPDDPDDDYDYDYEDEGAGGTRKLIIAAALISTIVVGGGFAYGYNLLFSGPSKKIGTPVVTADKVPAKIQPADPGGRKFEHTDSRLMNKIGNTGQADSASAGAGVGGSGSRVATLVVGRDGRLIVPETDPGSGAQSDGPAVQSAAPVETSPVPGMMIVGAAPPVERPAPSQLGGSGQAQPQQLTVAVPPAATPQVQQQTEQQPAAPTTTVRRRSKFPPLPERSGFDKPGVTLTPEATTGGADVIQANVRQVVPGGATADRVAGVPTADAANGYVAVLSTKRSRIDALTSFADLQQRYGSILSSKVPDVRRADLSSRGLGVMYRAVVGPPGSRQVAAQLCGRLKTAGYNGCWVAPY